MPEGRALIRRVVIRWGTGHPQDSGFTETESHCLSPALRVCHLQGLVSVMAPVSTGSQPGRREEGWKASWVPPYCSCAMGSNLSHGHTCYQKPGTVVCKVTDGCPAETADGEKRLLSLKGAGGTSFPGGWVSCRAAATNYHPRPDSQRQAGPPPALGASRSRQVWFLPEVVRGILFQPLSFLRRVASNPHCSLAGRHEPPVSATILT